jgi:hypothetical protein
MKIYIGFSKPTTRLPLFGWLIQAIIKRPYDHAYVRFNDPLLKKSMVFQASKEMVNLYNYHTFLEYNKPVKEYLVECNDVHYKILWDYITDSLGIPYSLKIDFGILLMKIFRLKDNPFGDNPNEEVCSELAARVCAILGIVIAEQFSDIDPAALDQILSNNKNACILSE